MSRTRGLSHRPRRGGPLPGALAVALLATLVAGAGNLAEPAAVAARERALAALAAEGPLAALDDFETALSLDPDNLRWGSEYRQAAIAGESYERAIDFLTELTAAHPTAAAARLNLGYAYVDKIPSAGAVTQVILANKALEHFSAALELEETWLGRYTRGNSYVYWPAIFGRTQLGIADLERAIELAQSAEPRPIHALAWAALGDGHWRLGDLESARRVWRDGLERYPGDAALEARLGREGDELERFLDAHYALGKRVDTDLSALWETP